jgi:hypothetical protein
MIPVKLDFLGLFDLGMDYPQTTLMTVYGSFGPNISYRYGV